MLDGLRTTGLLWLGLISGNAVAQEVPTTELGPVYLAYAGPYSSSPSSAFGHLFLVLPTSPEEPPPLWDVVSFNAETFDAGPVRYLTVGITGGFLGRYERVEFHGKARDYQRLEDRDLWLTRVELTSDQRQALEDELAATDGQWYPYTFFQKNCAFYLHQLLAHATGVIPQPSATVSPTEVMETVLNSELAGPSYFRPAASQWLEMMSDRVSENVMDRLRGEPWVSVAADTAWLRQLSHYDQRFVHEFFAWRTLHRRSALDQSTREGLALLRVINAGTPQDNPATEKTTLSADTTSKTNGAYGIVRGLGDPVPAPRFHSYSRFRLSVHEGVQGPRRISARFRPALHDASEPWFAYRPLNTLDFLTVDVSAPTDRFSPRLDAFVLFSQRSLSPSNWIATKRSWLLEVLARRGGLFREDGLHFEARGGLGKTRKFGRQLFVYGLATAAGVLDVGQGATFAPGVELGLVVLVSPKWRSGLRWTREHDVSDWSRHHERGRGWVRYDLGRRWGTMISVETGPLGDYVSLSLDWYP